MNLPSRVAIPLAEPFASQAEFGNDRRVKGERHCRQPCRGELTRKLLRVEATVPIFLQLGYLPFRNLDGYDVVERANLRLPARALRIHGEVLHMFGGIELLQVLHKLCHAPAHSADYLR